MSLTAKPKYPSHHKKRQAGHHRRSRSYMKTYWPYIPILAIVIAGFVLNHTLTARSGVLGAETNFSPAMLTNLTNAQRATYHLGNLQLDTRLDEASQAKANSLASLNYWSHTSPSGQTPWNLISESGYQFESAGENLAYGFNNPTQVINAWMQSPAHRANILSKYYQNVGFGISQSPNFLNQGPQIIVVAEYAEPIGGSAYAPVNKTNAPALKPVSRLQLLSGSRSIWLTAAISFIVGASLASLAVRHIIYLRRAFRDSEEYIVHHPLTDVWFVLLCVVGLLLIRSAGFIG